MDSFRPTAVHINLERLLNNFRFLRSLNPDHSFICPMIKANAYGHGDVAVAKALSMAHCQFVGVSSVEEGIHLREQHITETILVFGFSGRPAAQALIEYNLTPVISNFDQFSDLGLYLDHAMDVHIKFNTGMNRLGFTADQASGVKNVLEKNKNFQAKGLCTHFYSGIELATEKSGAWIQNQAFIQVSRQFSEYKPLMHAYNSAAITALYKGKKPFSFGMRPGLLVYGIDPAENMSLKPLVSPVMTFKSKIVSLQQVKSGEVVSYGGTWKANQDSIIGIVPAGYADGVCRSLSDVGEFLVSGQRVPIRGRVCMDYTMVDLTGLKLSMDQLVGQEVVLIGKQGTEEITVEDVAKAAGRITYEVMTGIGERVPRLYGANG